MLKLTELLTDIKFEIQHNTDPEITGLSYDSRRVVAGDLFFAIQGTKDDGSKYISSALEKGARAIVTDKIVSVPDNIPLIIVPDTRQALADISVNYYHNPSKDLLVIAVTGTNGKTTITYLIESIFTVAGYKVGVCGTINYRWPGHSFSNPVTTPESVDLQKMFYEMKQDGVQVVVMEVSSHSLVQGRVRGINYNAAIFTNLTRDHLDFHKTMENYYEAKSKLFLGLDDKEDRFAIINTDDQWGKKLYNRIRQQKKQVKVLSYGTSKQQDIFAEKIKLDHGKTLFNVNLNDKKYQIETPLLGLYNVYNSLAAITASSVLGIKPNKIIKGLEKFTVVPGRLEKVDAGQPFTVVVDYAHTDDALTNVLASLRKLNPSKIITVFGCGGDRDRSKRPLMGEAATKLSDFVFVTSDNPRSEDPSKIVLDIEVGIKRTEKTNYEIVVDRREAIERAIKHAQPGDIVLLAGKGHETYQIFRDKTIHFDDREIAREILKTIGY